MQPLQKYILHAFMFEIIVFFAAFLSRAAYTYKNAVTHGYAIPLDPVAFSVVLAWIFIGLTPILCIGYLCYRAYIEKRELRIREVLVAFGMLLIPSLIIFAAAFESTCIDWGCAFVIFAAPIIVVGYFLFLLAFVPVIKRVSRLFIDYEKLRVMSKKILLVSFWIIIIVCIAAIFVLLIDNSSCDMKIGIKDLLGKDNSACLSQIAFRQGTSTCLTASDPDTCYLRLSYISNDPSNCAAINSVGPHDDCYNSLVYKTGDISLCSNVKEIDWSSCMDDMLRKNLDPTRCNVFNDTKEKEWCLQLIDIDKKFENVSG